MQTRLGPKCQNPINTAIKLGQGIWRHILSIHRVAIEKVILQQCLNPESGGATQESVLFCCPCYRVFIKQGMMMEELCSWVARSHWMTAWIGRYIRNEACEISLHQVSDIVEAKERPSQQPVERKRFIGELQPFQPVGGMAVASERDQH